MVTIQPRVNGKFAAKPSDGAGGNPENIEHDGGEYDSLDGGAAIIDPKTVGSEPSAGTGDKSKAGKQPKRPRGRPAGFSPKQAAKEKEGLDLKGLNAILFSCHAMLAGIAKTPELALSEEESKRMAEAAALVARHYNFNASQKALDWANLIFCMGTMYGPRAIVISARLKEEQAEKKKQNGF